jgi:hypothetical protein
MSELRLLGTGGDIGQRISRGINDHSVFATLLRRARC